jgi:hypothetical protein
MLGPRQERSEGDDAVVVLLEVYVLSAVWQIRYLRREIDAGTPSAERIANSDQ